MARIRFPLLAAGVCLLTVSCSNDPEPLQPVTDTSTSAGGSSPSNLSTSPLDGLWSGSWGGGEHDGVVMQPVLSEMLIDGDYVDISGFPGIDAIRGTVRIETDARSIRISPTVGGDGSPPAQTVDYVYELDGERLTLTGSDQNSIVLHRRPAVREASADLQVEFVTASGINSAGDLLVTEFSLLRTGKDEAPWYEPHERKFKTQRAAVYVVEESGVTEISIDAARSIVNASTPVIMTFRDDGAPPDSSAVKGMLSRVLRPGRVVFMLSSRDNIPQP